MVFVLRNRLVQLSLCEIYVKSFLNSSYQTILYFITLNRMNTFTIYSRVFVSNQSKKYSWCPWNDFYKELYKLDSTSFLHYSRILFCKVHSKKYSSPSIFTTFISFLYENYFSNHQQFLFSEIHLHSLQFQTVGLYLDSFSCYQSCIFFL